MYTCMCVPREAGGGLSDPPELGLLTGVCHLVLGTRASVGTLTYLLGPLRYSFCLFMFYLLINT